MLQLYLKWTLKEMLSWFNKMFGVKKSLKINDAGLQIIKDSEGFRSKAYICPAGKETIGFGSLYVNGVKVKLGDTITEDEATEQLQRDVQKFETGIKSAVKVPLNENQLSALVCFVYNVGLGAFSGSTLLTLLNKSDYIGAADQLLRWNKAGGKVLPGLTTRREKERELFLKG